MQALPIMAAVAGIGQAALGFIGGISEASGKAAEAKHEAAVARENIKQLNEVTFFNERENDRVARDEIGDFLARKSASGLQVGQGSIFTARRSLFALRAKDKEVALMNLRQDVINLENTASSAKARASNIKTAGFFNAGASLLSGASNVANATHTAILARRNSRSGSGRATARKQ